ncbi:MULTISPECIES: hypothetical protein [unclassified Bradyrhizobium]|uniref:hypothetical protein n=1 Tax=unclassified Bradyrhizobium TaxID=2631580 RepID=UPI0028EAA507|nr:MULTISPECIES: hypothetical protein [unclassified Bradyrhizobium]
MPFGTVSAQGGQPEPEIKTIVAEEAADTVAAAKGTTRAQKADHSPVQSRDRLYHPSLCVY